MKKFVTTTLLGLATAACAFAFTACGGNEETSHTVTADEWKTALNSIYGCERSVESVSTFVGGEADGFKYSYYYDNTSNSTRLNIARGDAYDIYLWQGSDGKYYDYGLSWSSDESKITELSKEGFEENLKMLAISYTGNGLIYVLNENDTYSSATYDETDKVYKGCLDQDGDKFNYVLKFENKKIVKLIGELLEEDGETVHMTISVEYKYDNISVSVPDDIKNLPVIREN